MRSRTIRASAAERRVQALCTIASSAWLHRRLSSAHCGSHFLVRRRQTRLGERTIRRQKTFFRELSNRAAARVLLQLILGRPFWPRFRPVASVSPEKKLLQRTERRHLSEFSIAIINRVQQT